MQAYEESEDSDNEEDQGNKEINLVGCYTDEVTFDDVEEKEDEYSGV